MADAGLVQSYLFFFFLKDKKNISLKWTTECRLAISRK